MISGNRHTLIDFDAASLKNRIDNDIVFIREVLKKSIPTLRERLKVLNEAWYKRELSTIHDTAHSIKGLAQMLSFEQLSIYSQTMEIESRYALNSGAGFYEAFTTNPDQLEDALNRAEKAYLESELAP